MFTKVIGHLGYAEVVTLRRLIDNGDTLLELTTEPLSVDQTYNWSVLPSCGAVVVFSGTVRDHSDGRAGVETLAYEAYEEEVLPKCQLITEEMRRQWPTLGRIALIHRLGELQLGESSVLVHRIVPKHSKQRATALMR
jgi:molybdopterin synthase catalytic subunit